MDVSGILQMMWMQVEYYTCYGCKWNITHAMDVCKWIITYNVDESEILHMMWILVEYYT